MNHLEKILNKNKEKNNLTNIDIAVIQIITKLLNLIEDIGPLYNVHKSKLLLLDYKHIADILIKKNILKESKDYHVEIVKKSINKLTKPTFDLVQEMSKEVFSYIKDSCLFRCNLISSIKKDKKGRYKEIFRKNIEFTPWSKRMCNLYLYYLDEF